MSKDDAIISLEGTGRQLSRCYDSNFTETRVTSLLSMAACYREFPVYRRGLLTAY